MRLTSTRTPVLKSIIVRTMCSAGRPARSADSGWPCPDIRWQAPHANLLPGPPATDSGAGGCSSGNQSGGFEFPETLAHSYSFALPGALTMPCGRTAVGWTLSGILNAQSGSPAGTVSGSCALISCALRSGARAHTRTPMQVFVGRNRRIMAGLLPHDVGEPRVRGTGYATAYRNIVLPPLLFAEDGRTEASTLEHNRDALAQNVVSDHRCNRRLVRWG